MWKIILVWLIYFKVDEKDLVKNESFNRYDKDSFKNKVFKWREVRANAQMIEERQVSLYVCTLKDVGVTVYFLCESEDKVIFVGEGGKQENVQRLKESENT